MGEHVIGQGAGKSKKEAEQAAAQNALEQLPGFLAEMTEAIGTDTLESREALQIGVK